MGFKSASKSKTVNHSNGNYKINDLKFPSRFVFSTIESIDRNLRLLYSPAPPNSLCSTINYSIVRDNDEEFDSILDRVEERIDRFNEKVEIIEKDEESFNKEFPGITDFLYEVSDLPLNSEKHFEKRFINLAYRLWELGIHPSEF